MSRKQTGDSIPSLQRHATGYELWRATFPAARVQRFPAVARFHRTLFDQKELGMAINLKSVGGVEVQLKHKATCHCGTVEIELELPDGLVDVRRCDCSMCRRRGSIVASVPLSGIHMIKGSKALKLYQFNTKTAKHYFCINCGIYTHHQRRSKPDQYGFNVACLEGINPLKIEGIPTYDGVTHPADRMS